MKPLKVAGVATFQLPCAEQPEPLRPLLREVMAEPPRRVNRLIELALLGAHCCARGQRLEPHCPLYLALTHGSVGDNVALVSGASLRDAPPSPIAFINLSSNMAGFNVAAALGVHGSNQAIAASEFSFEAALELASLGHEERSQALIGAVEESAWPLPAQRERLGLPPDRALSECSHWLFVDQQCPQPLATVRWTRRYPSAAAARDALERERFPAGTLREIGGTPQPVHSGHVSAHRICRFVEERPAPALLHVSESPRGCYAVFVTA